MQSRARHAPIVAWMAVLATALPAQVPLTLTASHDVRSLEPGEIVLVHVTGSQPLRSVRGTAFGRDVQFVGSSTTWDGLVAIDVETAPGRYGVAMTAEPLDGSEPARLLHPLAIGRKVFETRRLTVDPQFVNPPAEELPRIEKETTLLANAFAVFTPERLWRRPFVPPVPGPSTGRYGELSLFNGEPRSRHRGTDFRAATGTPVRAPARGRVALSADLYFAGGSVIIDHGHGLFSQLAHLSRRDVSAGTLVEAGATVGLSGATGRVTGPHLHWAARLGVASIDPTSLLAVLAADAQ